MKGNKKKVGRGRVGTIQSYNNKKNTSLSNLFTQKTQINMTDTHPKMELQSENNIVLLL